MRICTACRTEKPLDAFDRSNKPDGRLKVMCRDCCRCASRIASRAAGEERKLNAKGKDYSSRNATLLRLGFATYKEYLQSDLWKEVRKRVYTTKGSACYLCSKPATELHHNRYHKNDLIGKKLKFINPICRQCHEGIEFQDGRKATLKQAARTFKKIRKINREETP